MTFPHFILSILVAEMVINTAAAGDTTSASQHAYHNIRVINRLAVDPSITTILSTQTMDGTATDSNAVSTTLTNPLVSGLTTLDNSMVSVPTTLTMPAPSFSMLTNPAHGTGYVAARLAKKKPSRIIERDILYPIDTSNVAAPAGYVTSFVSIQGATQADGYLTFMTLDQYDPSICAAECNSTKYCVFFNIYFEKDLDTQISPQTTDVIKCSLYYTFQDSSTATNKGQTDISFMIQITGSNGYNRLSAKNAPPGYTLEEFEAAINAPAFDKVGQPTFIQPVFLDEYDPALCAQACDKQTIYDRLTSNDSCHYAACVFANLYILTDNGRAQQVVCALYTQAWNDTYSVNTGHATPTDTYTIADSIGLINNTAAAIYPQTCHGCIFQPYAPTAIGAATLASVPAPSFYNFFGASTYFSTYDNCAKNSNAYISHDTPGNDTWAFYAVPGSKTSSCLSTGYLYHVESGLCATQAQTGATYPRFAGSGTSLQPCDVSGAAPPANQLWCDDALVAGAYTPYDCFTFAGDITGVSSSDLWYATNNNGDGNAVAGLGAQTYETDFLVDGPWCVWLRVQT